MSPIWPSGMQTHKGRTSASLHLYFPESRAVFQHKHQLPWHQTTGQRVVGAGGRRGTVQLLPDSAWTACSTRLPALTFHRTHTRSKCASNETQDQGVNKAAALPAKRETVSQSSGAGWTRGTILTQSPPAPQQRRLGPPQPPSALSASLSCSCLCHSLSPSLFTPSLSPLSWIVVQCDATRRVLASRWHLCCKVKVFSALTDTTQRPRRVVIVTFVLVVMVHWQMQVVVFT